MEISPPFSASSFSTNCPALSYFLSIPGCRIWTSPGILPSLNRQAHYFRVSRRHCEVFSNSYTSFPDLWCVSIIKTSFHRRQLRLKLNSILILTKTLTPFGSFGCFEGYCLSSFPLLLYSYLPRWPCPLQFVNFPLQFICVQLVPFQTLLPVIGMVSFYFLNLWASSSLNSCLCSHANPCLFLWGPTC